MTSSGRLYYPTPADHRLAATAPLSLVSSALALALSRQMTFSSTGTTMDWQGQRLPINICIEHAE
jgi:hypothetical protein